MSKPEITVYGAHWCPDCRQSKQFLGEQPVGFDDRDPYILETSVPGIFAAGDVRATSTKQAASATGGGASAALMIREYLKAI